MDHKEIYEWLHVNSPPYGRTGHGGGAIDLAAGYSSVLDVGGGFTPFAADARDIYEMSRAAVCELSEVPRLEQMNRGVEFMCADICSLPYTDGEFDLVTAFDVLEHIPPAELNSAIDELFRVADRRVIVSVGTNSSAKHVDGVKVELHETIQPLRWWIDELSGRGRLQTVKRHFTPYGYTEAGNVYYLVIDK